MRPEEMHKNQNTDLCIIEISKDVFWNLSPNLNTHDFDCVAYKICQDSTHVAC